MPEHDDGVTLGEVRRIVVRIEETLKGLVLRVEHEALERRVDELEEGRKSLLRIIGAALVGVVISAVVIALRVKGATP